MTSLDATKLQELRKQIDETTTVETTTVEITSIEMSDDLRKRVVDSIMHVDCEATDETSNTFLSDIQARLTEHDNPECPDNPEDVEYCHDIMDNYEAVLKAEYERKVRRRSRCLAAARKTLQRRKYQTLLADIQETSTHGFRITKIHPNRKPADSKIAGLETYVNQYLNGGMEGDSFAGQIWVRLTKRHFLTYHYSD